jgi:hypothetical protein
MPTHRGGHCLCIDGGIRSLEPSARWALWRNSHLRRAAAIWRHYLEAHSSATPSPFSSAPAEAIFEV